MSSIFGPPFAAMRVPTRPVGRRTSGLPIEQDRKREARDMQTPTAMDDYLFDLRGYLLLKQVVDPDHIAELNAVLDSAPPLQYGDWWGNMQRKDDNGAAGMEIQNIVEAGEPFERLIDHTSWIGYLRRYC